MMALQRGTQQGEGGFGMAPAGNAVALEEVRRALFIKLRHIGDVLLVSGTCKALKAAKPDVSISVLVPAGTEAMLTDHPAIDEVIPLHRGKGWLEDWRLVRRLRRGRFDLAVNMTEGDRGAILAWLSGARHRFGIDPRHKGFKGKKHLYTHLIKPMYDGRHRAVMDLDVLEPLGIRGDSVDVELFVSPADLEFVDAWLRDQGLAPAWPFVVVHPTSRWMFKCWRDEAVAQVVDHLQDRGIEVVLTSGPDRKEIEKLDAIASLCRKPPRVRGGGFTLKQLAALMQRSLFFFGVDTAPMHMAAALGKPVVALFGPSDSQVWGPLSPLRRIVDRRSDFPCLPCRQDGCDGSKVSRCLEAITAEEAIEAVDEILGVLAPAGLPKSLP